MLHNKIPLEDFATALNAALAARDRPYAGALVSFAWVPGADDMAGLVSCRWEFADVPEPPRATVAYPTLVLEERWIPLEDAVGELLRVLRGEALLGGGMLPKAASEVEEIDTSRDTFTGWREAAFEASLGHVSHQYQQTPVVAKGLRPYPSIGAAVNDWVWRKRHDPRSILPFFDLGKLRILLPDTRARIRSAKWVGGTLTLLSDSNAAADDVELQGVFVERRTSTMLPSQGVEAEVVWEVPAEADAVEVYLVHRDGTLLSHHRLNRGEHYIARPGDFVVQELAEKELRQGEGERVEYKPFIVPENGKEHELVRTAVAFSNTYGGRIYVGVEDDGTPQGGAQLKKIGKGNEKQALASVAWQLEKLIRERIKPVPDMVVSPIAVFGIPIVVVDVAAGEDAPYATSENDVFIRKGATNRKPDPKTEMPAIAERAQKLAERRRQQERLDAWGYLSGDDD